MPVAQKFRPPKTVTKSVIATKPTTAPLQTNTSSATLSITQQQTLVLTRVLLESSISLIAYSRELLHEDLFRFLTFPDMVEEKTKGWREGGASGTAYQEFEGTHASQASQNSQQFQVPNIRPINSANGDQLLAHIDEGIMDAVEKKFLERMDFVILSASSGTSIEPIESYTFTFSYDSKGPIVSMSSSQASTTPRTNSSIKLNNVPDSFNAAGRSVRSFLRSFSTDLQGMEPLPAAQRFLDFKLVFNASTPVGYKPPSFTASALKDALPEPEEDNNARNVQIGSMSVAIRSTRAKRKLEDSQVDESIIEASLSDVRLPRLGKKSRP